MIRAKHWIIVIFILSGYVVSAQDAVPPRLSPAAFATLRYKDTYIKITYCQPQKRGREIFGGLVPYGQVWRTGANEATEITLTKDFQWFTSDECKEIRGIEIKKEATQGEIPFSD